MSLCPRRGPHADRSSSTGIARASERPCLSFVNWVSILFQHVPLVLFFRVLPPALSLSPTHLHGGATVRIVLSHVSTRPRRDQNGFLDGASPLRVFCQISMPESPQRQYLTRSSVATTILGNTGRAPDLRLNTHSPEMLILAGPMEDPCSRTLSYRPHTIGCIGHVRVFFWNVMLHFRLLHSADCRWPLDAHRCQPASEMQGVGTRAITYSGLARSPPEPELFSFFDHVHASHH